MTGATLPKPGCLSDGELAAFAEGGVSGLPFERLAQHLAGCSACQRRLEAADARNDRVVQLLRRPPVAQTTSVFASPTDRPPARQIGAADRRQEESRLLYYRRLLLGTPVIAAALVTIVAIRLLTPEALTSEDSVGRLGTFLFLLMPTYAAGLAVYLRHRPDVSLSRLRALVYVFFALFALVLAYRQFVFLGVEPPEGYGAPGAAASHLSGANAASVVGWVLVIVNYGVFVPEHWRRVALATTAMALASLGAIVLAGLVNPTLRAMWPYLLPWTAVVLLLAEVAATLAAFQITALQRAVSEARRLGPYQLKQLLGSGGMGEVYLAEHRLLKRPCAVKLIRPERAGDPDLLRRFEREVRATSRLTHANTVAIYDYGHGEDGTFYYVMEYLPGPNLDDLVRRYGPLPPGRVVHFLRQICGALREAHAIGLVHRDVKPGNVIVCEHGGLHDVVKLLDFGLVRAATPARDGRLTATGVVLGTPDYMSPEQARGAELADGRSDLYSLGALAYFLLSARPPFRCPSQLDTLVAHLREPVPPLSAIRPEVPADLEAVVLRCLAKAPGERFPDAGSLDAALSHCACAGEWTEARAAAWWSERGGEDASTPSADAGAGVHRTGV